MIIRDKDDKDDKIIQSNEITREGIYSLHGLTFI